MEFARVFAAEPTRYPLRLIAFDLEEYGLVDPSGASEYAAQMRQQQQPLRLMISLEMLGYCDSTPVHSAIHLLWNAFTQIAVTLLLCSDLIG